MQILMGVNETIVRINNSRVYTENLVDFMQTQFLLYTQQQDSIILLYHDEEYHKRVFLMKWLYSLYTKISKTDIPNMKELLINRIKKPIKIQFKNIIEESIKISFDEVDTEEIVKKEPVNYELQNAMYILDIKENEQMIVIRKKYKTLLKRYHPDNIFNDSQEKVRVYTKKFQEIQSSYNLIMSHSYYK